MGHHCAWQCRAHDRDKSRCGNSGIHVPGFEQPDLFNLETLKHREDILVVANLVVREVDGIHVEIPANARVAKFIPIDLLLQHVDVLITTGDYGPVLQALRFGLPIVLAGVMQETLQIGGLVAWTGVGINLAAEALGVTAIKNAVTDVLGDQRYTRRAQEFATYGQRYDGVHVLDKLVKEIIQWKRREN